MQADEEVFWKEILLSIGDSTHHVGEMGDASKAEAPMLLSYMFISVATAYAAAFVTKLNVPREISERGIQMAIPGSEYLLPNRGHDRIRKLQHAKELIDPQRACYYKQPAVLR